jgi:DNA-binding transcriptional LysR family regulator
MKLSELKLEDLQLFITVADSTSFTVAAEHLQTNTSTLSRRVKRLEEILGARLLERTTRSQHITEAGKLFYQRCQKVLLDLERISRQINDQQDTLEGRISIYAPAELFVYLIKELVVDFSQQYPKLRVEFLSGAARPHLLEDNIDIMIHIDEPADSSFVARKINIATTSYYASPDYLALNGEPKQPMEMKSHDCIVEVDHDRTPRPWGFTDGEATTTIKVPDKFSSDSVELCRVLAEQGQGIAMLPDFLARESLESGRLVKLFGDRRGVPHNVYAVYASRKFLPRKTQMFLEFLIEHIPKEL